jgi:hypothetical protein
MLTIAFRALFIARHLFKHLVSEKGFSILPQMESFQMDSIDGASLFIQPLKRRVKRLDDRCSK